MKRRCVRGSKKQPTIWKRRKRSSRESLRNQALRAFHCQQAAEKDLKGVLVYHGRRPPRTHNLEALLDLCTQYEEALRDLYDAVEPLTPFAVDVRYPDPGLAATEEEATAALRHARQVRETVHACLPF